MTKLNNTFLACMDCAHVFRVREPLNHLEGFLSRTLDPLAVSYSVGLGMRPTIYNINKHLKGVIHGLQF